MCTLCQHQVAQDELAFMTHYRVFHQDIVKYHWQKCHFCWEYFPDFARLQAHYPVCNRGISQSVSLNFCPISSNFQFVQSSIVNFHPKCLIFSRLFNFVQNVQNVFNVQP